jgi:hypothetical protein
MLSKDASVNWDNAGQRGAGRPGLLSLKLPCFAVPEHIERHETKIR